MRHIEVTDDGSHTVRHTALGVTYHSTRGAITESKHVFIEHGLHFVAQQQHSISILEIGFGTGLNAFLTFLYALHHPELSLHYEGIEKYPLDIQSVQQLNYLALLDATRYQEVFLKMHTARTFQEKNFHFILREADVADGIPAESCFDVVYFDAFAPNAQPEMWDPDILARIAAVMHPGSVFMTYCAQGQFKRNLKAQGLQVEALPGPPGKREMVRAIRM